MFAVAHLRNGGPAPAIDALLALTR
jgi:hypothetical protein